MVGHVDPLSPLECPDYLHRFEVELHVRRNELPGQLQAEHLVERGSYGTTVKSVLFCGDPERTRTVDLLRVKQAL